VHCVLAILLAATNTFEQLAVLSTLATAGLYFLACAAAWRLGRTQVAIFGAPAPFRMLPVAAALAMACMVALVLFAEWNEIAGFAAVIGGSVLFFLANRALRLRAAG